MSFSIVSKSFLRHLRRYRFGTTLWRSGVIWESILDRSGTFEKSQKILTPKVKVIKSDELDKSSLEKIQRKLDIFIENKIKALMPNLLNLANDNTLRGAAAGVSHIFVNNLRSFSKADLISLKTLTFAGLLTCANLI